MNIEIGKATIQYDESGKPISAVFGSSAAAADASLLNQLRHIPASSNSDAIADNAKMMLADWWNKMNEIEMGDRKDYAIFHKVVGCQRHPSNQVKSISIQFTYKEQGKQEVSEKMI